ncbi:membrane or secreted protein [Segetibacter sp. 3557_3]|uniref:cellulase family glycosylhydrolase n=1 Tax=Segetibacter sp. 3557_3 TaxID=2547429 RepID=UPI00105861FE|nr:cellulase family glycosylhydrolase [Segetibacter sp. 3557_3]TDH19967.1 membrane or secreted protein [Segetibacter sp. 3557_3]
MGWKCLLFLLLLGIQTCLRSHAQKPSKDHLVYVDGKGVIRYTKGGGEAAFFGVNYTAPFAYGYRSIKALGLDVKQEIDKDVYHFARLGIDAFRVHVWDVEISDSAGNLLQNDHLDLFDYLIAALKRRGIKTIITPIAFWGNGYPERDERTPGFSTKWGKGRANVNDSAIRAQEVYLQQFFTHVNPYTKSTYHNDVDIIAVEINNEPSHSGPKAGVTNYINRMVAAVKGTGWTKPVFYNISQNPFYADAVAASDVNGFSMQWYPSGLVANREVEGNFLPHVDRYAIPFDTIPAYHNKARMVYEFDAADILQSNMLPAMARSFKTAGFQWATQFAYDPLATAYGNTEYQTHYLNLAYTPAKAISLLIASKVFHQVPRLKTFGNYPADSAFDVFRLSYKNNLSEMNSSDEYYHSNTTTTAPKSAASLQHLAGVGSSPVVQYDGSGAYFLDKLENGIWRLEVMPDAIHIRDPFERASPKKEVTRIEWNRRAMQIVLPDLTGQFSLQALDNGNSYAATATDGRFDIQPGTYLVTRSGKNAGKWNKSAQSGYIGLSEFVAPKAKETSPLIRYEPVGQAVAGTPLTLHLQAVGLNPTNRITLQPQGMGRAGAGPITFKRTVGNTYTTQLPAQLLTPGLLNYRIVLQNDSDYYVYPGNVKGNPMAWDYYNTGAYELMVLPEGSGVSLFDAERDKQLLTYSSSRRANENRLLAGERPGNFVYRMAAAELTGAHVMGFQTHVGDKLNPEALSVAALQTLLVRGRTTNPQPITAKLILVSKDAVSFSATFTLPTTIQDITVPVSRLQADSMLLLPRPYPGFMPLWFSAASPKPFSLVDVEKLQVVLGADLQPADYLKPHSMEIESVWIKK